MLIWTEAGWKLMTGKDKKMFWPTLAVPTRDVRDVPQGEAVPY